MRLRNSIVIYGLLFSLTVVGIILMQNCSSNVKLPASRYASTKGKNELTTLTQTLLNLPTIYCITPTYARLEQKAELTRLSQTLLHVPKLRWIVVEDSNYKTELVTHFLKKSNLHYTHLNITTPIHDIEISHHRGRLQRNLALNWIRNNFNYRRDQGVLYFADDDNTYDLQLFQEMRYTQKVSVWPVGFVYGLKYGSPICQSGKVTGWFILWARQRQFALDMAGFAVNVKLILENPEVQFDIDIQNGYLESSFLSQLVTMGELEPKACDKILVWHTKTEKHEIISEEDLVKLKQLIDLKVDLSLEV